ncbi:MULTISPECIES: CDP-glycerol glycerophosphotransferase family protein [Campylobacter]|uniref:CDP-glycerol glycerophosphotransferase family protein n=1 Tax=Campylobacter TaxID=194 RepID=UPI000873D0BA|nr:MULTISPECIES: CDP-glycerol glycerophosphotransferase family protein [Campylobacter]EAL8916750.1 glycosyltransferase [Campylobacter jejuni]EJF0794306.1 CDP-glycerol glycerophosphotransferase family protein [Campylobacter jejuni]ELT9982052.1 CDP-glycerol glycerophosphotransferase family protein [Campylobacter jejuni]OEV54200.1 capsular biosynthesis protein [Campylobacter jejuni]OEW32178.1 capsular biosynthesis protein [Campylobacter jejuni]
MLLKAKYKKNIFFFFKSLLISLENFLKQFKPKKYKAYNKYIIISAVYNVEKYLDDFFKSVTNQRLNFKSNIYLICVDDGSTDNSANIIKRYQKKYPKNIIYLYKKNGGQASARNLGLKYLKENDLNIPWVTFTDSDDFLDRDYFYEVDSFLKNQNNIAMVATNIIFYREKRKILYKDTHALNFKFKRQESVCDNVKLNENIQLSVASCFLRCDYLQDTFFDENLTLNFEDGKFINIYLFKNLNLKSVFLKNARYFYRKRFDKGFFLNKKNENKIYYLEILEKGYLELLNFVAKQDKIPIFIQNVILYELFWQVQELVNHPEKLSFINQTKIHKYLDLLEQICCFIDSENIIKFNFNSFLFLHKMGFLHCFKKEKVPIDRVFIEQIDDKNDEILIKFYTTDVNDEVKMLFDDSLAKVICSKIRQYDFLNRVFIYERRIWLKFFIDAKNMICFINDKKVDIIYQEKRCAFYDIFYEIKKLKKRRAKNKSLWLFADMPFKADDNAEHLYRYIMKNYPEKNIVFVLRKNSHDYKRLKKEGFKLVDPKSFKFKYLVFKADKLISSHIDRYFFEALGENTLKTKDFIFLQHGITQNDLSSWLNQRKIDLFITGMQDEYDSIVGDFNHYKFTPKEVKLTGFPRWDALLKNNQINTKQIIIMPTWREYIVGSYSKKLMKRRFNPKFYESEYFYRWGSFLHSKKLQELHEKYDYKIVFNPHPQIRPYLEDFNLPNYIIIPSVETSIQKLFCESSLMITDYSSVAFEMIILKKPVIYYQFDQDYFFCKHFLRKGFYNYKKIKLSYLVNNQKDLIFCIEFLLAQKI